MVLSKDLKIVRNGLSVLIAVLGITWLWATKQQHWLKDYIEPCLVVVGSLVALCQFLMQRWVDGTSGGQGVTSYNIPNTTANKALLKQAKTAIGKAHLSDALKFLAQINTPSVLEAVTLLSGRLARHGQQNIQGVLSHDKNDRTLNTLSRDTLALVSALEDELKTGADYQKTIKSYLLDRYTKRLFQKMAERQPINLRLLPTTEGTSEETSRDFEPIGSDALKGYITGVFQAVDGRLMITGVQGAGKTSVLLELAVGLLEKDMDSLPVLLNLATWKTEYITLDTWLKEVLPAELGVLKQLAVHILQQDQLIVLFDGFDEIKDADRISCLEAIGRYGATAHRQFVITSRIAEYKAVAHDAPVYQQIEVGGFTLAQIEAELERLWREKKQPEAKPLLHAIQQDAVLQEAVEVPFYFNTLQLLFAGGKRVSDLYFQSKTVEGMQAAITEQFVTYTLGGYSGANLYGRGQAKRYLSFLAFNMSKRNKVVFELVDLQYDWYGKKWSNWEIFSANFVFGLVVGFSFGFSFGLVISLIVSLVIILRISLITGLIFSFFGGLNVSLIFGLFSGLFSGLIVGLLKQEEPYIKTRDSLKRSLSLYMKAVKKKIVFGISSFIGVGLVGVIFHGFVSGIVEGLIVGLLYTLVSSLFAYINDFNTSIIKISKPYQRFRVSMWIVHFSILQHIYLLYKLSRKGLLPFKIVHFLNTIAALHILESDGATWRFRHRILQEYFADLYSENVILNK